MSFDALFSPIKIRGLELKNRVILPAMMTKMASSQEGLVTQRLIDYYKARAKGGCGLVFSEVCAIHESTHGTGYLALYKEEHKQGLKRMLDEVHAVGGKMGIQIWHGGQVAIALLPPEKKPMVTEAMTKEDIKTVVNAYGRAARLAVEAGCDCLEFHAAHTYLPHTFLSPAFNKREDEYNGSLENRARFALECIEAMRKSMPEDMPLFMRVDAKDDFMENGLTVEDIIAFINMAAKKGVDVADISRGNNKSAALMYEVPSIDTPRGYNAELVAQIKAGVSIPVSAVGRINDPALADQIISQGKADFIAMGRAQITDPSFCNKAKEGKVDEIRRCVGCDTGCFDSIMDPTANHITCMRNPFVGKEDEVIPKADKEKTVLIAGGGMGGMMAANLLKLRGHRPILCEASDRLGGQMHLAGKAPYKSEMLDAVKWEANQLDRLGVEIRLNTSVTPKLIKELKPDAVVVAIGAEPIPSAIPGADLPSVFTYEEVLSGKKEAKGNTVIIGGKMVGLEVAQTLTAEGAACTVLEPGSKIGADLGWVRSMNMLVNIPTIGVKAITGAVTKEIKANQVVYQQDGEEKTLPCDCVVIAMGARQRYSDDLIKVCKELAIPFDLIGDAEKPRLALNATADAARSALRI